MRLFHVSDIHLSFSGDEQGKILKPMDQRVWSKGSQNYVGYLEKMEQDYRSLNPNWNDLLIITGDLSHDMSKKHVRAQLDYLGRYPGVKLLIRGNHDHQWDFGLLRSDLGWTTTGGFIFLEEGSFTCYGPFLIGCYSDHRNAWGDGQGEQPAFSNLEQDVLQMVHHFARMAKVHKKIPIMVSHYPVPLDIAEKIGKMGIKMYLSGHVHCTNNKVEGGTDWSWYDKSAGHTDDKVIEGCYFSTATTDVMLNRHGKIIKEVTNRVPHQLKEPGPKPRKFVPPRNPAEEMIVLVGLPGCGKSTYCQRHLQSHERISQDDLGSKGAAVQACEKALGAGRSVVIDRVNFDAHQRAIWVDLAKKYRVRRVVAVYFDPTLDPAFSVQACIQKVRARQGHPTINDSVPDERKGLIVESFAMKLTTPDKHEGFDVIANP